jgi:hypothetical protein
VSRQWDAYYEKEDSALVGCYCGEIGHGFIRFRVEPLWTGGKWEGDDPPDILHVSIAAPVAPEFNFWRRLKYCWNLMRKRVDIDTDMEIVGDDALKFAKWIQSNIKVTMEPSDTTEEEGV